MRGIFLIVPKHWYNVSMEQDFDKKHWGNGSCPKYDCKQTACKCGLEYVNIPTSLGDDSANSAVAPKNGAYCNALVVYEANDHVYIYSKEGVPTLIDVDASDVSTLEQEVRRVQKEIDELKEDNTFILKHLSYVFKNVQEMKASTYLSEGDLVRTLGFYSLGDGGSAYYTVSSLGTPDDKFVHALSNGYRAHLENKKDFNILQIGAKRDDSTFDNVSILQTVFKSGLQDTTVHFPEGVYHTTRINYVGDNQPTSGLKIYGENATIKLLHPNKTATFEGYYSGNFTVSYGFAEIDFGASCTVNTIKLADGKEFFYLSVSNKTLIPASLKADMVIKGATSGLEAYIASIDAEDPDGAGTARIYLYAAYNEKTRFLNFTLSGTTLNEKLIVKKVLGNTRLYIHPTDNVIPSYIADNLQIKQGDRTARVNSTTVTFGDDNFIEVNCMPEIPTFVAESTYLVSNTPFEVYDYTGYTAGMLSLNKYKDCLIDGITFDGNSLEVSKHHGDANNWNSIITGGCKNITIRDCKFINSIMAGIQMGGMANAYAAPRHGYPENVNLLNCYFYNNGRGDIEVIYGTHINISRCNGSGILDIEANGSEVCNNISIDSCNFAAFTPYSPATTSAGTLINVSNSTFTSITIQNSVNVNLVNCSSHALRPYVCEVHATNCSFDLMNGYHGNEHMFIENSSLYGLYRNLPASQFGKENIHFNNCIIDLSLTPKNSNSLNRKTITISNSYVVSSTIGARISDNRSIFNASNTTFKNVSFFGAGGDLTGTKNTFKHCSFLVVDNTVASSSSDVMFSGGFEPTLFEDCYFEAQIRSAFVVRLINCIVNEVTKPYFASSIGITVSGLKTRDGSGINWDWVGTPMSGKTVLFNNVEFSPDISQTTLGIKAYSTPVSTSSVSDGCTGYFVGSTTHALVQMYHNSGNLAVRYVDFV